MTIIDIEQGSEAWFTARTGKFTGTKFSDLMASKGTAAYQNCIAEVAGEVLTEKKAESYSNAIMERGTELEPEARQYYINEIDEDVEEVGFCLMDNYEDWVGISPDGLTQKGMIEIKCPLIKTHLSYIEKGSLPSNYKWQVQGGLMVTGSEYSDFVSYFPGLKSFILRVYPDYKMHRELKTEIDKAIELVKTRITAYNNYDYLDNERE